MPTSVVPKVLRNNETFRNSIINALINGTNTNWIDKFYEFRTDLNTANYTYDLPNTTVPTVFGSADSYGISKYSKKLSKNVFDNQGIECNFATLGNEGRLSTFIYEMYTNNQPFIANLYRFCFVVVFFCFFCFIVLIFYLIFVCCF